MLLQLQNTRIKVKKIQKGSIYIVKPKMHGPDETAFTVSFFKSGELFNEKYTCKIGIMDEEENSANLHEWLGL